jgi:hypothetical protein
VIKLKVVGAHAYLAHMLITYVKSTGLLGKSLYFFAIVLAVVAVFLILEDPARNNYRLGFPPTGNSDISARYRHHAN